MKKLVIVGNSAAAISALKTIREQDKDAKITLVTEDMEPYYSRVLLPYYIKGDLPRSAVFLADRDFYGKMGAEILYGRKAIQVLAGESSLELSDGARLAYDGLLIASGAKAALPETMGMEKPGVFVLRTLADADLLKGYLPETRQAVVIGAGLIGLKTAETLAACGLQVTVLIGSTNQVLPRILGEKGARFMEEKMQKQGIAFRRGLKVSKVLGDIKAEGVELTSGEILPADLVFVGAGTVPNVELARGAGLVGKAGIAVDNCMRTRAENIYAAGDAAEMENVLNGQPAVFANWPNAVRSGQIAGFNLAGAHVRASGEFAINSFRLFGTDVCSIGLVNDEGSEEYFPGNYPGGKDYYRFLIREDKLVGVQLVGDVQLAGAMNWLIRTGQSVSKLGIGTFNPKSKQNRVVPEELRSCAI